MRCEKNIASERTDEFNEVTKNNGMPEDISILDREPCTEQFRLLSDWTDCSPTQFSKYIDWYRTKENNSNKRRMKVTNAQEIQFNKSSKYESPKADFLSIRDIKTAIENIQLSDYIDDSKIGQLNELISLLKDSIFRKRKGDVAEESAVMLTNYSINKIKAIADKNTDSVSKPSKTGYREFAHARLRLLVAVDKIRKNLEPVEVNVRYMYILGLRSASKRRKPVSFDIRREAARLDRYRRQFALLHKYRIENSAELSMLESALQSDIDALIMQRRELYSLKQRGNDVRAELERINLALRPLRQELRLCRQIEQDMPRIREQTDSALQSESIKTKTIERRTELWK